MSADHGHHAADHQQDCAKPHPRHQRVSEKVNRQLSILGLRAHGHIIISPECRMNSGLGGFRAADRIKTFLDNHGRHHFRSVPNCKIPLQQIIIFFTSEEGFIKLQG